MGRITVRRPLHRVRGEQEPRRVVDTLAVEEPLEIRVDGRPLAVTMRTPGHDVELATGFLVSEGVLRTGSHLRAAIHCGGPGTGGTEGNTYNVLDLALAPGIAPPDPSAERNFYTTSSCGVCGKASIEAVHTVSVHDVAADPVRLTPQLVTSLPVALRAQQKVFESTGGLHAAGLFDAASGEALVVREDVGRHNAVDKVVGWAAQHDLLPATGTVLQVSGRASFELVQKAVMAGIPVLSAVSAPSSLAAELAEDRGLTLIGFVRGESLNVYARADRVLDDLGGEGVVGPR
ncbi:formate dehydrogenase accessory sulfurtransferase FdhD [Kytococcus sp. Marseille-QA3725]